MKFVAVALAVLTAPPGSAKTIVLCKGQGRPDVVITLQDHQAFNHTLDCISGNFIADMTPCAPNGGYGLSGAIGRAPLSGVVMRWQDYMDHLGGVVGHAISSDRIYFDGGFVDPSGGMKVDWSFDVSRLTGVGVLHQEGKPDDTFTCGAAKPKF